MNGSITGHLIRKDWALQRWQILAGILGGAVALGVFQIGGETAIVVGSVWLFVALIVVGCMLPVSTIVNERKKQNLAFVMSLPVSVRQYTTAKLISSLGMFLAPWLTLVIASLLLIEVRGIVPRGAIPISLVLLLLPFVGFCLITGAALVGESEGWAMAMTVICNSSYGLIWYFIARVPAFMNDAKSPVPIWSSRVISLLGAEAIAIVLTLALAYVLQSRKRDFI